MRNRNHCGAAGAAWLGPPFGAGRCRARARCGGVAGAAFDCWRCRSARSSPELGLGELRAVICASPAYLVRHGTPATPAALAQHACISSTDAHGLATWSFAQSSQKGASGSLRRLQPVSIRPRLSINDARPAVDSVLEGRGLARMMSYQIVPELQDGRLAIVLAAFEPPPLPVHLLFPRSHGGTAKIRGFVGFAVPRLRADLAAASAIVAGQEGQGPGF